MDIEFRTVNSFINQRTKSSISQNQAKLAHVSNQLNSGQTADNYTDIVGTTSIEGFLHNKFQLSSLNSMLPNNKNLIAKFNEIERILSSFSDLTKRSLTLLYQTRDPSTQGSLDSAPLVKNLLDEIKVLLNSSFQGQKLFAGLSTGVSNVVGDITNVSNVIASMPSANYYLGSYGTLSNDVGDQRTIEYGINAANPAFQNLIAAHHFMLDGDTTRALDVLNEAKTQIGGLTTIVGTHNQAVSNQIAIDEAVISQLRMQISEVEDTDLLPKYMELARLQTQLKASFSIAKQLKDLSLVNYI
jgi:flagellar hook-associated protein 3 FlgL